MTRDTLNETVLDTVSGGLPSLVGTAATTIAKPHIARDHDLLTPEQIAKVLSIGINFPIPRSSI